MVDRGGAEETDRPPLGRPLSPEKTGLPAAFMGVPGYSAVSRAYGSSPLPRSLSRSNASAEQRRGLSFPSLPRGEKTWGDWLGSPEIHRPNAMRARSSTGRAQVDDLDTITNRFHPLRDVAREKISRLQMDEGAKDELGDQLTPR